jgi:hypothetical protein
MKNRGAWIGLALGACAAGAATVAVLVAPAGAVAFGRPAADEAASGAWTIEPTRWKDDGGRGPAVQLTLKMRSRNGRSNWNSSSPVALSELRGLTAAQLQADSADVQFQIVRDAGTLSLDGRFRKGTGAGHFTFAPSADYVAGLRGMGYGTPDADTVFSLALHDVSRDFIRELAALGYDKVPLDKLIAMRIHGATPEFVRGMKALGYTPDVDKLIAFRIHGVSADFVRGLKGLGYERADADGLVALRIHGVTVDFVRELKEMGYEPPPSLDELVSMRIHGATSEYVRALRGLGYEHVPVDDLVSMRIHGVSPEFIRRVNGRQGGKVPVDRLVSMRIHGRDEE